MAYGFTADLSESQDIAQEAFSRAWQRWKVISYYEQPISWVRRVATHLAHSRWRRLKVASAYLTRQRIEDLPELSPDHVDMVAALRTLPVAQRKAVVLHYLVDLPVAQIAEELGVADGTVKSWLHRGRIALAAELGDEVRRTVSPVPAAELRLSSDKRRAKRRAAASAVAAFIAVVILVTGAKLLGRAKGGPPMPPAIPTHRRSVAALTEPDTAEAWPGQARARGAGLVHGRAAALPGRRRAASYLSGGDPTGRYLIGSSNDTNIYIWRDGKLDKQLVARRGLDDSRCSTTSTALGPRSALARTQKKARALVYLDGEFVRLKGAQAMPMAINESNVIVGTLDGSRRSGALPTSAGELLDVPPGMDAVESRGHQRGRPHRRLGSKPSVARNPQHSSLLVPGRHLHRAGPPPSRIRGERRRGALASAANGSPAKPLGRRQGNRRAVEPAHRQSEVLDGIGGARLAQRTRLGRLPQPTTRLPFAPPPVRTSTFPSNRRGLKDRWISNRWTAQR